MVERRGGGLTLRCAIGTVIYAKPDDQIYQTGDKTNMEIDTTIEIDTDELAEEIAHRMSDLIDERISDVAISTDDYNPDEWITRCEIDPDNIVTHDDMDIECLLTDDNVDDHIEEWFCNYFVPSDHNILTSDDFDPDDYDVLTPYNFCPEDHDLMTSDAVYELIENETGQGLTGNEIANRLIGALTHEPSFVTTLRKILGISDGPSGWIHIGGKWYREVEGSPGGDSQ